jgi:hypothetical protein
VLVVIAVATACLPPRLATVRAPEDRSLPRTLSGTILLGRHGSAEVFALPAVAPVSIERARSPATIDRVAGPDEAGRIAFLVDNLFDKTYSVLWMTLGAEAKTTVFTRPGSYWPHIPHQFGGSFALSLTRGRVATLADCHSDRVTGDPSSFRDMCDLEVWDLATAQRLPATVRAADLGVSWFPDAARLAYVTLVDRAAIPAGARAASDAGHPYNAAIAEWPRIPVVAVLDVETGSSELFYEGENPLVSPDGSFLLLHDDDPSWKAVAYRRVNLLTRAATPVVIPGATHEAFALLSENIVLYRGLPTKGAEPGWRCTSTFGMVPFWTLKVAELDTGHFATLLPKLDVHDTVSFGRVAPSAQR